MSKDKKQENNNTSQKSTEDLNRKAAENLRRQEIEANLSGENSFISTVTIEHCLKKLLSANAESNFTSTFDLNNLNSRKTRY